MSASQTAKRLTRRVLFCLWWPLFLLVSLCLLPLIHASSAWFEMAAEVLTGTPEATRNAWRDHAR